MIQNSYRLLVIDVDGTLVGKDGNISTDNKLALASIRNLGITISLSTGRAAQGCSRIIDELKLDGYHIFFDGALVSNLRQNREIYVEPLDKTVVKQAIEFASLNDIDIDFYSPTRYFIQRETWLATIHRDFFGVIPTMVDFTHLWQRERLVKGGMAVTSPREATKARDFHRQFNSRLKFSWVVSPSYPKVDFINLVSPKVSKGKALSALAARLGIPSSRVIAIGDGNNDISMLSSAGLGIAMGNAPDAVKQIADYVTLDVEDNGLANAIHRFLL